MNIDLSYDKITGLPSFCETDDPVGEYHGELFVNETQGGAGSYLGDIYNVYVFCDKAEALDKWRELNEARKQKVHEVYCEGVLKIDKIRSESNG